MTLSDLANVATIVSGFAVLGSLVYLALQTRQNTKHTSALIQQTRNQQGVELNLLAAKDPRVGEIFRRGDACDPTLTSEQAMSYFSIVLAQLQYAEENFNQFREGLLSDERQAQLKSWLQTARATQPGFRVSWSMCRGLVGLQFAVFLDRLIEEMPAAKPVDAGAVWLRLAAKEREKLGAVHG